MAWVLTMVASCSDNKKITAPGANHAAEAEKPQSEVVALTQQQMTTVGIKVGHVERRVLGSSVRANGLLALNPQDRADVTSLVGGIVQRVCVVEGQQVRAGQTVAYVANTSIVELQKDYLVALKERQVANQELLRQQTLATQGAGIGKTLQQAEAQSEIARARLTGLRHQLSQIGISASRVAAGQIVAAVPVRSAIGGTVNKIMVSTGSSVAEAGVLMQVADNRAVYASLNVYERDIQQVKVGQTVDLTLTNSPGTHLKGVVRQICRSIDSQTKTIDVHVAITQKGAADLMAGMYVTALIATGQQQVSALPDEAIVSADGKKFVFVLTDEALHFRRTEVITGASAMGYTQVNFPTPVAPSASVVTKGAFYLGSMTADHGEED